MRIRFVDNVGATKTMGQMRINHASKHLKPCFDFPQSMRQIWRFNTLKFPYIALVGATLADLADIPLSSNKAEAM